LRLDAGAAERGTKQIEEKLAQGLSRYFGRDIRVQFEALQSGLVTPARRRVLAEQDKSTLALTSFTDDPAVRGLRERFGADIDAASVKPGSEAG
jgi:hypothetical protein